MKKILFVLLVFFAFIYLNAGEYPLRMEISSPYGSHPEFNYISYDDLNWKNPEDQIILFNLNFTKINQDFNEESELRFEMSWNGVKSVEVFGQYQLPLVLTNQDIIRAEYPGGKIYKISGNLDAVFDALKPLVLDSGRIPDGDYTFTFVAVQSSHGADDNYDNYKLSEKVSLTFTVKSPMEITLVSPGNPITSSPVSISTRNPYFVWVSNLESYIIKIWEDNGSANTTDQFESIATYYKAETNAPNFEYPPNAPVLRIGKVYAWQVIAPLKNSLTNDDNDYLKSKIYHFRVTSEQNGNQTDIVLENYITRYKPEGWQSFLELIKNGFTIEQEDLDEILKRISAGKRITKIELD
jgi:hypothetical protein